MTTLEQRLRDELDRAAPDQVPPATGVEAMRSTVAGRRRRNRLAAGLAGAAAVVVIAGAFVASRPESGSDVIASAPETETQSQAAPTADEPATDSASNEEDSAETGAEGELANAESGAADGSEAETPAAGATGRTLQASPATPSVETRRSAVDFAGGSGVFVVPTADGYFGLASRFGGDRGVTMIAMESENGLDWTEVGLSGVPAGATITLLRDFDGSYFAAFSQFDAVNQRNVTRISSTPDLRNWSGGVALPGDDTVLFDLAVGRGGLMAVGMAPAPTVWTGPAGGPYEEVGRIDGADTVVGVAALGDGFVVAGTNDGSSVLFTSADGENWTMTPVTAATGDDSVVDVAVAGASIVVAGDGAGGAWTASSSDDGGTWRRSDLGATTVDTASMRGTSVSLLGTSPLGVPEVTIADDESWSSAQLDIAAGDRVELLIAGPETLLLAADETGLTWVLASR